MQRHLAASAEDRFTSEKCQDEIFTACDGVPPSPPPLPLDIELNLHSSAGVFTIKQGLEMSIYSSASQESEGYMIMSNELNSNSIGSRKYEE